jgi:hypothetical protein
MRSSFEDLDAKISKVKMAGNLNLRLLIVHFKKMNLKNKIKGRENPSPHSFSSLIPTLFPLATHNEWEDHFPIFSLAPIVGYM